MYCIRCGKKVEDHELYCTNCGTKVEKTEILEFDKPSVNNTQINQNDNVSSNYNNNNNNYNNYNQNINNNSSQQNRWPQKLVLALIFGIMTIILGPLLSVITLILAIIGIVLASRCNEQEQKSNKTAVIIVNVIGIFSSLLGCLLVGLIVIGIMFAEEKTTTNYTNNKNNIITEDKTKYIENTWYCGLNSNVDMSNYSLIMNFTNGSYEWLSSNRTSYIRGTYDIEDTKYGIYNYKLIYRVTDTSLSNTSSGSYYYMNVEKDKLQLYSSGSYKTYYCTTSLGSQNQL